MLLTLHDKACSLSSLIEKQHQHEGQHHLHRTSLPGPRLPEPQTAVNFEFMASPVAHTFWDSDDNTLPPYTVFGLRSAVKQFGTVILWRYVPIQNAPAGVEQRDAAELLSVQDRDAILGTNVTIAHVSDAVRFRAAARLGGWVVDCDCIWLRTPPAHRTVFSTLFAKNAGNMAPRLREESLAFRKKGWPDGRGLTNTPIALVPGTAAALAIEKLVHDFVEERRGGSPWAIPPRSKEWNVLMHGIKRVVLELGLGECVRPPIEYGAALSWGGFQDTLMRDHYFDEPVTKFGVRLPSAAEILDKAYCIPTSFVLAGRRPQHAEYIGCDVRAYALAHPSSLLGRIVARSGV